MEADEPSELFRNASGTRQSLHPRPRDLGTGLSVWDDKTAMRAFLIARAIEEGNKPPKANDPVTVIETGKLVGFRLDPDPNTPHHHFLTPAQGSMADWIASDPDESPLTGALAGATLRIERFG